MGTLTDIATLLDKVPVWRQLKALPAKVAELEARVAALEGRHKAEQSEFEEHRGAVFKRRAKGGFHKAVYCPGCASVASPFEGTQQFHCDSCQWSSSFSVSELPSVLKEVEEEYS